MISVHLTTTTHQQIGNKKIIISSLNNKGNHRFPKRPKSKYTNHHQQQQRVCVPLKMEGQERLPLSAVVSDCTKRWFEDTLKEAKAGDTTMQALVGQMYCSGYGVPKDEQKGRAWMSKASRSEGSSESNVSSKNPGYNVGASDSDKSKACRKIY